MVFQRLKKMAGMEKKTPPDRVPSWAAEEAARATAAAQERSAQAAEQAQASSSVASATEAEAPRAEAPVEVQGSVEAPAPPPAEEVPQEAVASVQAAPEPAPESPAPEEPRTYRVVSGDTLSAIALRFYGDAGAYMRIFEANRDKLNDPNLIYAGQDLIVP